MATQDELNASFDKMSKTALKVKRDRDRLLSAADLALAGLMNPKMVDFEVLEHKLRTAIEEAKKP